MTIETFSTKRLTLRLISPKVIDYVYTVYSKEEQLNFFAYLNNDQFNKEKKKWKNGLSTHNRKFLYFHMLNSSSGTVIGWCGYHTWYTDHDRAEVGYQIFIDEEKQKGLMKEALNFIIEYGFQEMKLHRIEAMVSPENIPSLKLLHRFGFVKEGLLKEHYLKNGVYEDSLVYSLIQQ